MNSLNGSRAPTTRHGKSRQGIQVSITVKTSSDCIHSQKQKKQQAILPSKPVSQPSSATLSNYLPASLQEEQIYPSFPEAEGTQTLAKSIVLKANAETIIALKKELQVKDAMIARASASDKLKKASFDKGQAVCAQLRVENEEICQAMNEILTATSDKLARDDSKAISADNHRLQRANDDCLKKLDQLQIELKAARKAQCDTIEADKSLAQKYGAVETQRKDMAKQSKIMVVERADLVKEKKKMTAFVEKKQGYIDKLEARLNKATEELIKTKDEAVLLARAVVDKNTWQMTHLVCQHSTDIQSKDKIVAILESQLIKATEAISAQVFARKRSQSSPAHHFKASLIVSAKQHLPITKALVAKDIDLGESEATLISTAALYHAIQNLSQQEVVIRLSFKMRQKFEKKFGNAAVTQPTAAKLTDASKAYKDQLKTASAKCVVTSGTMDTEGLILNIPASTAVQLDVQAPVDQVPTFPSPIVALIVSSKQDIADAAKDISRDAVRVNEAGESLDTRIKYSVDVRNLGEQLEGKAKNGVIKKLAVKVVGWCKAHFGKGSKGSKV